MSVLPGIAFYSLVGETTDAMQIPINTDRAIMVWAPCDAPAFLLRLVRPDDLKWIVFVPAGVCTPPWITELSSTQGKIAMHDPAWGIWHETQLRRWLRVARRHKLFIPRPKEEAP